MDDPVAIAKLNEQYFRSGIPQGTYDCLHRSVTSKDKANMLEAAWILYLEDFVEPQSILAEPERKRFDLHVAQEFLPGGEKADIIEAVGKALSSTI